MKMNHEWTRIDTNRRQMDLLQRQAAPKCFCNLVPLVPLRGYLFPLSVFLRGPSRTPFESFPTPWSRFADPLPDLWRIPLVPPPTPSWPFAVLRALRGYLFAFSWKSFLPLAILGRALSSLLQPLSGPSSSFVPLRGYLFPLSVFLRGPSRTPFESFPTPWSRFADPLPDLWRIPLVPPPTPSWPFAVLRGPSWISFCLFVEILSPLSRPLADPS